mmetsp:Transcript_5864/g.17504  ORF Transcript_5864/g.17504 Transcript_5864/m.17504 type:complete len:432 (-) Transcript_5864:1368-2663(-)|eukprot:CAMPEP_0119562276 /NCGR_PEP_ID=MMETSP1352-20130426/19955_1 /TAXON_ID=265584 /ORGANISM="Stauroneis constricta, Strain CCMP1120" /LENGTH=431 /DNA_ID=CAMNT_0007610637 /DNA_START=100 /DNA_END=1395 /DNA_ORIENTATION=-
MYYDPEHTAVATAVPAVQPNIRPPPPAADNYNQPPPPRNDNGKNENHININIEQPPAPAPAPAPAQGSVTIINARTFAAPVVEERVRVEREVVYVEEEKCCTCLGINGKCWCYIIIGVFILISVSGGVGAGTSSGSGGSSPTFPTPRYVPPTQSPVIFIPSDSPSTTPTSSPTNESESLLYVLEPILTGPPLFVNPLDLSVRTYSVPYRAMDWMTNIDIESKMILASNDTLRDQKLVERYALVAFYFKWGVNTRAASWWESELNFLSTIDSVCEWNGGTKVSDEGVTCDSDGSVTRLRIHEHLLGSSMPRELGLLTHMTTLSLSGTSLGGRIPAELGFLTALRELDLSDNVLTRILLPSEASKLDKLESLSLQGNRIKGDLNAVFCLTDEEPALPNLTTFFSDCRSGDEPAFTTCSCCTACCIEGDFCISN